MSATAEAASTYTRVHRRTNVRERRAILSGLLFGAPWILGFLVFGLIPFFTSLYYSFTFYTVLNPPSFIGLRNYANLAGDIRFRTAVANTLYLAVFSIPLTNIAALCLALLLNMRVRGLAVWRTIFYLPSVTPVVATAIVWLWMFSPQAGLINYFLSLIGISGPGWLADPKWAKAALVIMSVWGVGGGMLIYLASLQDVPQSLYEAAEIDGAGAVDKFFHVTLPMISPVVLFNVVTGLIGALQYFTQVHVMTGGTGGPADSTLTISLYLWMSAFQFFKMGYASAQAWFLFIVIALLTIFVFRSSGRFVYYAGR
jgi:multiple sugar transport system permease protein